MKGDKREKSEGHHRIGQETDRYLTRLYSNDRRDGNAGAPNELLPHTLTLGQAVMFQGRGALGRSLKI